MFLLIVLVLFYLVHPASILPHPLNQDLFNELYKCRLNSTYCTTQYIPILNLCTRIANEHAATLLYSDAQDVFKEVFYYVEPKSVLGMRINHILAVLSFAQGNFVKAKKYWLQFSPADLVSQRTLGAQVIMSGAEKLGLNITYNYTAELFNRFKKVAESDNDEYSIRLHFVPSKQTDSTDEYLLSLLLSEAQGFVRVTPKLSDLLLSFSNISNMDSKFRFRLGVGLAKLGLFDLSLKHVWQTASPWEAPLYRIRAKLVFSPVHSSKRALASAVDNFERHGEDILTNSISIETDINLFSQRDNSDFLYPTASSSLPICNSFNEAALALQSLPLLHLAGFAAPRQSLQLGHSPVGLPVLLSEVYENMCSVQAVSPSMNEKLLKSSMSDQFSPERFKERITSVYESFTKTDRSTVFKLGIVSGSFDGILGRIIIGILESMSNEERIDFEIIAMCFPTARGPSTDRVTALFDRHVNLSPCNKTQSIDRILEIAPDFILFADVALDSRVFALAHERLALYQGALWGWGGTTGIPTLDYYFIPEILWSESRCARVRGGFFLPQELFFEQVIFLEGMPFVPRIADVSQEDLRSTMRSRYLVSIDNSSHIYLFPGSVKHMHPEFDQSLEILMRTDPMALVIVALPKSGRDQLPPTHIAVRHDLTHPSMPPAAVSKLRQRLKTVLGDLIHRVRFLPPLDESLFRALQKASIAVLDPYPVGMHVQMLDAMFDQVPVVSAPALQECTNSHAYSFSRFLQINSSFPQDYHRTSHSQAPSKTVSSSLSINEANSAISSDNNQRFFAPSTPEEYGVLAVQLNKNHALRDAHIAQDRSELLRKAQRSYRTSAGHGSQLLKFMTKIGR